MASTLGELLDAALERQGMTLSVFAKKLNEKLPHLTEVRQGKRKVPRRHIVAWADVLGLAGVEREEFLWAAALPHCPPVVRELVAAKDKRPRH